MADILTQLQTCLDQLSTQFYSSLRYISTYHDTIPASQPSSLSTHPPLPQIPKNPPPPPNTEGAAPPNEDDPHPAAIFENSIRELARDLVIKEQQIEALILALPGIESSEGDQEGRIRVLEEELRAVRREREGRRQELEGLLARVRGVLGAVERRG